VKIVWDPRKARSNAAKHDGVTFEDASRVLFDPFALTREDVDSQGEQRFVTLGMDAKGEILVVVYTYRKESIRLIAAWKANREQRTRYETQRR
jgi:uncharacterized protein